MKIEPIPDYRTILADRVLRSLYCRAVRLHIRERHLAALAEITEQAGISLAEWIDQMVSEKLRDRDEFERILNA